MSNELLAVLYLVLIIFGIGFNKIIGILERFGMLEGFTWSAVVIGVGVTLGAVVTVCWNALLSGWHFGAITLGAFAASGLPMAAGSIWRYVSTRRADQSGSRAEVRRE